MSGSTVTLLCHDFWNSYCFGDIEKEKDLPVRKSYIDVLSDVKWILTKNVGLKNWLFSVAEKYELFLRILEIKP